MTAATSFGGTARALPIALVSIDTDLERGSAHGQVDTSRQMEVADLAARYLAVAERLLSGSADLIRFGYDPALSVAGGGSRYIASGDAGNRILMACCEAIGVEAGPADIAIVFGPSLVSMRTTPELFMEMVADDLTAIIRAAHPVECKGPIATLMPFLVQVAGNIIIPGHDEAETGESRMTGRKKRAIGRAFNAIAHGHYGSDNAHGKVVTDHPAWLPLANAVAESSVAFAQGSARPLDRNALAYLIQQAIARAMRACDITVNARA